MTKLNLILLLIIAMLVTAGLYVIDAKRRLEVQLESARAEATYWKDEQGRSNAEVQVLRVEKFKQTKMADSLRNLDIKPRTVQKVVTIRTHSTDTVTILKSRPFGNGWATFEIEDDKLFYHNIDSIALVTHSKRVGLFNRAYVTRAISFNPHTTLTGITSTEILPKTRRISIGGYAGYGLQFSGDGLVRHGWNVGVGVNLRIF